jgi:hypothetical protein
MTEILINENGNISLASISRKQDLVLGLGTNLNPPPEDGRCECCGRHMSELKPFGKSGDPLVGDFEGALLVKNFREAGFNDEEAQNFMRLAHEYYQFNEGEDSLCWLWKVSQHGEEEGASSCRIAKLCGNIVASWECRDCIVLDDAEYLEKLRQSHNE